MSGKIPQSFIDDLLARVDIVDLIDARVTLKKTGANYSARCPFHSEKTPSFTVSREKQFYHCFGCGAHGTAIGFLMEHDRLGFVEAVEELAALCGLTIPRETAPAERVAPSHGLYELQLQVAGYYAEQLRRHPQRARAVDYLRQRGVSGEVAARYGLGYAPPGWDNLGERFETQALLEAGLLVEKDEGRRYDRFRDRIMFPIRDRRGRVVGFGGRVLDGSEPKYLNSPETAVFKKRREVYGLYELLKSPGKPPCILVVEGYMDVVALAQFGIPFAVAALGTAISAEHVELLFRYTSELVFCFDGDAAGHAAGWRAMEAALPHMRDGRQVRFLHVPQGHDPDTLVRAEGRDAFQERIHHATPLSDYFFKRLQSGLNLTEMEGRAGLVMRGRELLSKLPSGVFQQMMLTNLAQQGGVAQVEISAKSTTLITQAAPRQAPRRMVPSLVRRISELILRKPDLALDVDESVWAWLADSGDDECAFLQSLLEIVADNPHIQPAGLLERFRDSPHWAYAGSLSLPQDELPESLLSAGWGNEFADALQRLKEKIRRRRLDVLIAKMDGVGLTANERAEYLELTSSRSGGR
ncbi:MAG: DNA primase [Methylococcaceae bacterium]|nr:MAG: DNA primase [Methylococcaceae bacterium]